MKIEELSIGDWVMYRNREWQVCSLYQFTGEVGLWRNDSQICENVADLHPIPLTPGILEKNGICLLETFEDGEIMYACPSFSVLQRRNFKHWKICTPSMWVHIRYIHQLQHALRLAGIEKEIEV